MTSSDVLDTCLNVQLVRAADLLIADVDKLLAALERRAFEHKLTPTIGPLPRHPRRAHHLRAQARGPPTRNSPAPRSGSLLRAREVATCAISGAVGTFAQVDPRVEAHVAKAMGLTVEPVSTQIIPRDRHAMYFATLGVVASSAERLAHRGPPPAAHRGAGGRGFLLRGARRAPRRCRTSATRCCRRTSPGSPAWCAPT
jgi:adenylosuccinate lyase